MPEKYSVSVGVGDEAESFEGTAAFLRTVLGRFAYDAIDNAEKVGVSFYQSDDRRIVVIERVSAPQ